MQVPAELKYTKSDEWVRLEGDVVTIGITDYAQHELGELVYVEVPEAGQTLVPEVSFGVVESVKAVAELIAPVAGEVIEANTALPDNPSTLNESPYEEGWIVKARIADPSALDGLLSADEYSEYRK